MTTAGCIRPPLVAWAMSLSWQATVRGTGSTASQSGQIARVSASTSHSARSSLLSDPAMRGLGWHVCKKTVSAVGPADGSCVPN